MSVLIKWMKMPNVCDECWALDECGDYPMCRITGETRGYNFRVREKRMDRCPLIELQLDEMTAAHEQFGYNKGFNDGYASALLDETEYKKCQY